MCVHVYIHACSYEKRGMTKKKSIRFYIKKEETYELFWLVHIYMKGKAISKRLREGRKEWEKSIS